MAPFPLLIQNRKKYDYFVFNERYFKIFWNSIVSSVEEEDKELSKENRIKNGSDQL